MSLSFVDILLISLFCMALVFVVLFALYLMIILFSKLFNRSKKKGEQEDLPPLTPAPTRESAVKSPAISAGQLILSGLDEKQAAMIMAIVSYESKIPLSELTFKSIKLINEKFE